QDRGTAPQTACRAGASVLRGLHGRGDRDGPQLHGRHRAQPHFPRAEDTARGRPCHGGAMNDETLIRQAIAEEADQAVDPSTVLAALREAKRPRRQRTALIAIAGVAVATGVVAVVVPLLATRNTADAPPADAVNTQPMPTSTAQTILLAGSDGYGHTDTMLLVH